MGKILTVPNIILTPPGARNVRAYLAGRQEDSFFERITDLSCPLPIGHWPQNETTGTDIICLNNGYRNGVYTGVTLSAIASPHGYGAPQYDAINDFGNIYSASLATALTSWDEGTVLAFIRMRAVSVWTDGVLRRFMDIRNAAQTAIIGLTKNTTNNQLRLVRTVGGGAVAVQHILPAPPTDWFAVAMTWSQSNNRLRGWYSTIGLAPAQIEATQVGLNTWSGVTIPSNFCTLGCTNSTTPAALMDGYLGDMIVWNAELDFATQLSLLMVL